MPNVMAALPNIGGALYKSSLIPLLVPRRKVWLTPSARAPCSNAKLGRKANFAPSKISLGSPLFHCVRRLTIWMIEAVVDVFFQIEQCSLCKVL